MSKRVTLIPGDGIGPEVTDAVVRILEAAEAPIEWETRHAGAAVVEEYGDPLPDNVLDSIRRNKVALKGPVTTPVGRGFQSVNVRLRRTLDMFVNLRPIESLANVPSRYESVDLVIVRENTEGLYSGLEHEVVPGVVESLKIVTEKASRRIARFAFEYAIRNGRKRITAVHKANIMKQSDGLFLSCFREVAEEFPQIEADERIVDNMAMQLVVRPEAFDMLVMPNLYGDILSDLCAGLAGGLGVVPGANLGVDTAVFEAVHGSAPDIAGQNLANPVALLRSAILMLEHLELREAAARVRAALHQVVAVDGVRTRDIGGEATTSEFRDAIVAALA